MADSTLTSGPGTGRASPDERIYRICDADGRCYGKKHRTGDGENKDIRWSDHTGSGYKTSEFPFYGSERANEWDPDEPIILVEGEKAVDALDATGAFAVLGTLGTAHLPAEEFFEVLRGRILVGFPDTDDQGREHMNKVLEKASKAAAEVRVFTWHDAPEVLTSDGKPKAQDAADHPAVQSKDPKALDRLLNDFLSARKFEPKKPDGLPFVTARQIGHEVPAEVPWRARPWIADGAITELDGRVKSAGKTTFAMHLTASVLDGRPFMGEPTRKTGVVMLTEQGGPSFTEALKDAGLLDRDDLLILRYGDVIGAPWGEVAKAAVAKAEELGYGMLVVDTIGQFAGLKGDAENNAGAALDAMSPLQAAAAKGLAVLFTRHERKSGGEVGTSGRGSSAYSGVVDLIMLLRRAEGNVRETVRKIETLGRFHETPASLMIEKTDRGYVSLGTETAVEKNGARERILRAAPTSEAEAKPKNLLLEEASVKYHTGHTVLSELVNGGELRRNGEGKKGDPHRFWRPDPPGDDGHEKRSVEHISNVYQQKESSENFHSVGNGGGTDTKKNGHRADLSVGTTSPINNRKHSDALSLFAGQVREELRRSNSGPAKALYRYLEDPDEHRLEHLTKAVLVARNLPTISWEARAPVVADVADDPSSHPLECQCEGCL